MHWQKRFTGAFAMNQYYIQITIILRLLITVLIFSKLFQNISGNIDQRQNTSHIKMIIKIIKKNVNMTKGEKI
jgi:hypothetical protein